MKNSFENIPEIIKSKEKPSISRKDPLVEKFTEFKKMLEKSEISVKIIEELNKFQEELEKRLLDELTGLPKAETAKAIIIEAMENNEEVVMEFADLKYLKVFNKTIGHEKTNEMLKNIGEVYQDEIKEFNQRGIDVTAIRYGGDEFLLIIKGESQEEAQQCLDKIHQALRKKVKKPKDAHLRPRFWQGVASSKELSESEKKKNPLKLIDLADKRVIKQKEKSHACLSERLKRTPPEEYQLTKKVIKEIERYSF